MEKINIRGQMNALPVNGILTLPKSICRPSTVRVTAGMLKETESKTFAVSVKANTITVTRIS